MQQLNVDWVISQVIFGVTGALVLVPSSNMPKNDRGCSKNRAADNQGEISDKKREKH